MIHKNTHTINWINELTRRYKGKDPGLIEKCIKALALAEELKKAGLDFVFKGGTALLILFKEASRLSIDLDIIIGEKSTALKEILNKVISSGIFKRYDENIRKSRHSIPKVHYKFYYDSLVSGEEVYVLLDILFEKKSYPQVQEVPLESNLLLMESPGINVTLPTIDSILGDKFTTIAPNTIGIPFNKRKDLEIGKQLFDLDRLFDAMKDVNAVKKAFVSICEQEIGYRGDVKISVMDVINDSFDFWQTVAFQGRRKNEEYKEILSGIGKVGLYDLNRKPFQLDNALKVSGTMAYLGKIIRENDNKVSVAKYNDDIDMAMTLIKNRDYNRINKIKNRSKQAFFYWYQAIENV